MSGPFSFVGSVELGLGKRAARGRGVPVSSEDDLALSGSSGMPRQELRALSYCWGHSNIWSGQGRGAETEPEVTLGGEGGATAPAEHEPGWCDCRFGDGLFLNCFEQLLLTRTEGGPRQGVCWAANANALHQAALVPIRGLIVRTRRSGFRARIRRLRRPSR
jgi:hypothetical protein